MDRVQMGWGEAGCRGDRPSKVPQARIAELRRRPGPAQLCHHDGRPLADPGGARVDHCTSQARSASCSGVGTGSPSTANTTRSILPLKRNGDS